MVSEALSIRAASIIAVSTEVMIETCRLEMLRQQNPSDVEVAITPEELEGLDEASIQALYNQRVAEERARNAREVSQHTALCVNTMMLAMFDPCLSSAYLIPQR